MKLPDSLSVKLAAQARQRGLSKSALVQQALEAYFEPNNGVEGPSCYELGKGLWGSVEGPGDLSTNKRYMEGYGQ